MVQVDFFWSYSFGASFACAAYRQLEQEERPARSEFFIKTLLFVSLLFAPSGIYLLWEFPGWETMFAGDGKLPGWLVTAFAITNVSQGILGFFVATWLIKKGKIYAANLQYVFGYIIMFFILVHGWDGIGYKRFLYSGTIEQWQAGIPIPFYKFFTSDVALALYGMGVVLVPVLAWCLTRWLMEGYRMAGLVEAEQGASAYVRLIKTIFLAAFALPFVFAVGASLLVHLFGFILGILIFLPLLYFLGLRKGGFIHGRIANIVLDERV